MKLLALLLALLLTAAAAGQSPPKSIWISRAECQALPDSGPAWTAMKAAADKAWSSPSLSNQDDPTNCYVLAAAFVWAKTGTESYRTKVRSWVSKIPETENGGRTLALGRELAAYIVAIDLVGWDTQAKEDSFKAWLKAVRTEPMTEGTNLIYTHENRPNNWGTHAGASRVVADVYLGDTTDLAKAAKVFKGWLGDRASYAGFTYGSLIYQSDPAHPVGVNPNGATIQGHLVGGVLPDDQRRCCTSFTWPPPKEPYAWEALQGVIVEAWVLSRFGYADVFQWQDQAILRAYTWLHGICNYPAEGDDTWQPWIVNSVYGTTFPAPSPTTFGKNMGFSDWTHSEATASTPPPPADFSAQFDWHWQVDSKTWLVHKLNSATEDVPGTGATEEAALADWLTKNKTGLGQ